MRSLEQMRKRLLPVPHMGQVASVRTLPSSPPRAYTASRGASAQTEKSEEKRSVEARLPETKRKKSREPLEVVGGESSRVSIFLRVMKNMNMQTLALSGKGTLSLSLSPSTCRHLCSTRRKTSNRGGSSFSMSGEIHSKEGKTRESRRKGGREEGVEKEEEAPAE